MVFAPYHQIQGNTKQGLLLLGDHAMSALPQEYGSLGLSSDNMQRHIAYDIGIEALTKALNKRLDAPALMCGFSRLLIDPNRGNDDPTLIMQLSDGAIIPGNYPLSAEEKQKRLDHFYHPYDKAVTKLIENVAIQSAKPPLVISLHSFTPVWKGMPRPHHIGLLWDKDDRVFQPLYQALSHIDGLIVGDNEPYDGALQGDMMYRQCTQKGYAHILIEVRQDLISSSQGIEKWADRLAPMLAKINGFDEVHKIKHFGSRCN